MEIEKNGMAVEFRPSDETFDHAFGRTRKFGREIIKIEIYCEAIKDWIDVTSLQGSSADIVFDCAHKMIDGCDLPGGL